MNRSKNILLFFMLTASCTLLLGQSIPREMNIWPGAAPGSETLDLELKVDDRSEDPSIHNRAISQIQTPKLEVFTPEHPNGTAVLICPGGAYKYLAYDHEGPSIAKRLNEDGVTAFVLTYRLPAEGHKNANLVPLQDAQRAMRLIRFHAEQWGLNPEKLGIMGFSAGGHLASTLGTYYNLGAYNAVDEVDKTNARPDFMILIYPVISMENGVTHQGSRENLLGKEPPYSLVKQHSNELWVDENTPPTFIALASDDRAVVPENSIRFFQSLLRAGVPVELHSFEKGGHGFGILLTEGPNTQWPTLLSNWMKARGL
jgi:acetyl esterase/lipase